MTLAPDYTTLALIKAHMGVPSANTDDDTELSLVITAASRAIDQACGRQFGSDATPTVRVFTWDGRTVDGRCAVDVFDLATTTGLVVKLDTSLDGTFATTITNGTDFDLYPFNASVDGVPWTDVVMRPTSSHTLPRCARGVQVTATFGWAAVPKVVNNACLIQATRLFKRRETWAGVAGSPELGSEVRLLDRLDPDLQPLLASVVRYWGAV